MVRLRYEYRINKKGCECFRTDNREEATSKLKELQSKYPNAKFDLQSRSVRLNRVGTPDLDWRGRPMWSQWN